ncbi:hypothetical protein NKH77_25415 [Streptomyces sp. M19]
MWPQILEAVKGRRRFTWILLSQNASVVGFDGTTLQLGFANPGARDSFVNGGSEDVLRQALSEAFNVQWRVEAVVDPPAVRAEPGSGGGPGGGFGGQGGGPGGSGGFGGGPTGSSAFSPAASSAPARPLLLGDPGHAGRARGSPASRQQSAAPHQGSHQGAEAGAEPGPRRAGPR